MLFVLTITFWALIKMTLANFKEVQGFDVALMNAGASMLLLVLAIYLVTTALLKARRT
jgi:hypothetical protein